MLIYVIYLLAIPGLLLDFFADSFPMVFGILLSVFTVIFFLYCNVTLCVMGAIGLLCLAWAIIDSRKGCIESGHIGILVGSALFGIDLIIMIVYFFYHYAIHISINTI